MGEERESECVWRDSGVREREGCEWSKREGCEWGERRRVGCECGESERGV